MKRKPSPLSVSRTSRPKRRPLRARILEVLELRLLMSASFDITGLTKLRQDSSYSNITGSGVGIAVLDTGIYAANPDLKSNVVAFYNAVENAIPTTISSSSVASAVDNDGHGSHVAGIAASSNPSIGVAYQASIISVKVIPDSGESTLGGDPLLRGLQFVAKFADQLNIKVVNMSLGESTSSGGVNENTVPAADDISAEIKVLEGLGITVVAASGNSYANDPVPGASYPAVVSTLSVANTWADSGPGYDFSAISYGSSSDSWGAIESSSTADIFSATSQRSTLPNQVAAPGMNILSTWNDSSNGNTGTSLLYNTISGTSMAAPFVSGLVALIQQAAFTYGGAYFSNVDEVRSIIENTSDKIVDSNITTNGRVKIVNGTPDGSQTYNLPETGDTFDRVDVYNAIAYVRSLYSGTASTADLNDTEKTATSIPSINGEASYTRTGNIGTDGINNVGANDVDLYSFSLVSPGTLSMALSGTPFAATLRLFDSSGNQLSIATGTSSAFPTIATDANTILPIGTYYVGVSSAGNNSYSIVDGSGATGGSATGDYSLTVGSSNPDPNGVPQGAVAADLTNPTTVLSNNQSANEYSGILGSDPAPDGSSTRISVPNGDVDMFKVVAPDTGTLLIETSTAGLSSPADTYLAVFDSNLNQISSDHDSGSSGSLINLSVTSGDTYYVAVTTYANAAFSVSDPYDRLAGSTATATNYTLDMVFNNGNTNGTAFLATPATVGTPISAALGSAAGAALTGADGGDKYVNFYTFTPSSSGLLDLKAQGTGSFSPSLSLWTLSSSGTSLTQVGTSTGSSAELIYAVSPATTYYVSVTGQGNTNFNWYSLGSGTGGETGNYTLTSGVLPSSQLASLSDSAIDDTPQTLTSGTPIYGNIGQYGPLIVGNTDVDIYKFVPTASGSYDFRTDTSGEGSADTVLRLFDAGGNQIAINDNASASTTASFIRIALTAGTTYYVGVSGSGNSTYSAVDGSGTTAGSTGTYGLMVSPSTTPVISLAAPASAVEPAPGETSTMTFTVSLDIAPTSVVTVDYHTEDGTAIAGADYDAASGTLTFQPGQTSQPITITLLPDTANSANTNFVVGLSSVSSNALLGPASAAQGTIINYSVTTLSFTSSTPRQYTDGEGRRVTLRLSGPGTGLATFLGAAADPSSISLSGTTLRSALSIIASRGTSISNLTVSGSLGSISAATTSISGASSISGSLQSAKIGAASGTLEISGTAVAPVLSIVAASNLALTSAAVIKSLTSTTWAETNAGTSSLTAPAIGTLTVKTFAANLHLTAAGATNLATGSLGVATGTWSFAGRISKLALTSLSNATITAESLGTLSVSRTVTDSSVRTTGNITAITAGTLTDSTVFAGVSSTVSGLPSSAADFTSSAAILSLTVRGLSGSPFAVTGSDIAAATLGRITLGTVDPDNGGTPFGIAGDSLKLYTRKVNGKVLSSKTIVSATDAGDAVVRAL
jgi:subtilisin family serine protease